MRKTENLQEIFFLSLSDFNIGQPNLYIIKMNSPKADRFLNPSTTFDPDLWVSTLCIIAPQLKLMHAIKVQ